jgi:hypothetical protein
MQNEEKLKVMSNFQKYLASKDISEITQYSLEDLKHVDASFGNLDLNAGFRIAMRNRIKDLEALQAQQREGSNQRLLYFAYFVSGVVIAVVAQWIIKKIGIG